MMFDDSLTVDNIDLVIADLKQKIVALEDLRKTVSSMHIYEIGIRKNDCKLCFLTYSISNTTGVVNVVMPNSYSSSPETFRISIETFQTDYVVYSTKTRSLFPKR